MNAHLRAQREQSIQDWLVNRLSEWLAIDAREISIVEPFANYGLSSVAAVSLAGELSDWLEIELSPILAYEYPTVEALARHLAEQVEKTVA